MAWTRPAVLILDDFAMREFTPSQADDLYELITERTKKSLIITANRSASDWYSLFPNPVVAESILDRIVNVAHHIHMDGKSYRPNKRPGAGGRGRNDDRESDLRGRGLHQRRARTDRPWPSLHLLHTGMPADGFQARPRSFRSRSRSCTDPADERPTGRVWSVQLRRGTHTVVVATELGRPSAENLAAQIGALLNDRPPNKGDHIN